MQIDSSEETKD
jgi:hypothetical protein